MKIWRSDELLRDFVPCIRTADNEPCIYEKVYGAFYTPYNGKNLVYDSF